MQTSAKKECEGVQVRSSFESAPNSRNLSARSRCPKQMEIRDGDDFTGCSHEQEVGGHRESDREQLSLESEILEKFVSKNEKPENLKIMRP